VPYREQQRERPLLGDKEALEILKSEYQDASTVFLPKINSLVKHYIHFRRTRQDGNCFYRSFLFGLLESLLTTRNKKGALKMIERVKGWKDKLIAVGYQELVFEDALDLLVEFLEQVTNVQVWLISHLLVCV
jgi:ubiquitin thioesterase protein OTUB1